MRIMTHIILLVIGLSLSACGPLAGQLNKTAEGLQDYETIKGDIMDLQGGGNLLVVGPFSGKGPEEQNCASKEDCIYPYNMDMKFVTKYNDARRFAHGLQEADLFNTELYLEVHYDRLQGTIKHLKTMDAPDIEKEFQLKTPPDMILFGAVKKREHKVAPMRGIIVDVQYELEFYSPETRQSIVLDIAVVGRFKDDLQTIIEEIKRRISAGK